MKVFAVGEWVAWDLICGHVMAGRVNGMIQAVPGFPSGFMVTRVDGTTCGPLKPRQLRPATPEEIHRALCFYTRSSADS